MCVHTYIRISNMLLMVENKQDGSSQNCEYETSNLLFKKFIAPRSGNKYIQLVWGSTNSALRLSHQRVNGNRGQEGQGPRGRKHKCSQEGP